MAINFNPPYLQTLDISDELLAISKIDILRLDVIHPVVSGNKWYKLKGYLDNIKTHQLEGFITFGGAFSNHLSAAAFAAKAYGISARAIVRGKEFEYQLNDTLQACNQQGMILEFVDRATYKLKHQDAFLKGLQLRFPNHLIIPEGGNSDLGWRGFEEILSLIHSEYTHIITAVGSGTTITAIRNLLPAQQKVIGFVPMKNGSYIKEELCIYNGTVQLIDSYHFGGFGKHNTALLEFMNTFYRKYQVPLDVVYTAKLFYGLFEEIRANKFPVGSKILVIHSGGLQGNSNVRTHLCY